MVLRKISAIGALRRIGLFEASRADVVSTAKHDNFFKVPQADHTFLVFRFEIDTFFDLLYNKLCFLLASHHDLRQILFNLNLGELFLLFS